MELPALLLILLLLLAPATSTDALQLIHQWKAARGSILAADAFVEKQSGRPFLATGGHSDEGRIRLWPLGGRDLNVDTLREGDGVGSRVHDGSIFSISHLRNNNCAGGTSESSYLVSGSFDRSAAIHRVDATLSEGDDGTVDVELETIGRLPEHTGWVRGVQAVQHSTDRAGSGDGRDAVSVLSIGCNLINVWTVVGKEDDGSNSVVRLARLDAGPSPSDPPEETFRRHDILSVAIVGGDEDNEWIVAGLVDGTLRVFDAKFVEWYERRNGGSPYDATGSCDCATFVDEEGGDSTVEDEKPSVSAYAHEGRVTSVLDIPGTSDFVSVGHDGMWVRWNLSHDGATELSKVGEGYVPATDDGADGDADSRRICSSIIVPDGMREAEQSILYVGTTGGRLYKADVSDGGKCELIWKAEDESRGEKICCVSSMAWMKDDEETVNIICCRSDGVVMIFR
mmetsp:Transcript_15607/g.34806  ORF Transcript_15607/g.34806 Transcript_15607/m.34806 type:complete len:454 (+) Transcript_15607:78-1439(+)